MYDRLSSKKNGSISLGNNSHNDTQELPQTPGSPQKPQTPWYNTCTAKAFGNRLLNAGVDSIGPIPEAGGLARVIGHEARYVGVVADKVGSKLIKAGGKTAGVENSAIGFDQSDWTSWVSAGITVGDFIAVVNESTTVAALSWDTGVAAYKVYQCSK